MRNGRIDWASVAEGETLRLTHWQRRQGDEALAARGLRLQHIETGAHRVERPFDVFADFDAHQVAS